MLLDTFDCMLFDLLVYYFVLLLLYFLSFIFLKYVFSAIRNMKTFISLEQFVQSLPNFQDIFVCVM